MDRKRFGGALGNIQDIKSSISILEIGFGTGLNALLSLIWADKNFCNIDNFGEFYSFNMYNFDRYHIKYYYLYKQYLQEINCHHLVIQIDNLKHTLK